MSCRTCAAASSRAVFITIAVVLGEYTIASFLSQNTFQTALLLISQTDPYVAVDLRARSRCSSPSSCSLSSGASAAAAPEPGSLAASAIAVSPRNQGSAS